ncbi:hypothetical protein [Actinomadura decatromicini]|uniref:Pyridoxamine 5'-phosphate oxidase family protein n=1 Tax=Actinomadura decatromicini TaxID=2604572 RepID=A0A5D3FRE5_9ACTN|nr:hypothetical protein [Actinomadura decatromicini]TYK50803.1 hypothetical protein FXF68_10030 [Actinomadura decatromicini]
MTASPDVLSTSLDVIRSAQARRRPVLMLTGGADGRPRVCVPDWGELRVLDGLRLRVAVWPDDPTAVQLDRGAPVLLVVADSPDVHLIHATPRRLADAAMVWAHYELTITSARIAERGTAPYADSAQPDEEVLVGTVLRRRPSFS